MEKKKVECKKCGEDVSKTFGTVCKISGCTRYRGKQNAKNKK